MSPLQKMFPPEMESFFIDFDSVPESKCFIYELLALCEAAYPFSKSYILDNIEQYNRRT